MNKITRIFGLLIVAILFLVSGVICAQNSMTVKGTIKDSKGEPVIGAAVMIEGTSVGVISDIDGNFMISLTPKGEGKTKLLISSIGYLAQTVEVDGKTSVDVVLAEDMELLDEVVVVGYGAMKKSDLTGSVTSVKIDETKATQSGSIDQLLQGHAAGVQVVSNSAAPDSGVSITIRGASSFNSNSQPLFVVDGVLLNTDASVDMGSNGGPDSGMVEQNNGLIGISPQDIATIEILKDASATAIYGSQGANGVILITTKSATKEKPVVTFSAGLGFSSIYKKFDLMNVDDYKLFLERKGILPTSDYYTVFTTRVESGEYSPVDWQDYATRFGVDQRYYLTAAGRTKSTNYRFSIGYRNNEGIIEGTGYGNLTSRLNLDKTIKNFRFGVKASLSYLNSHMTQGTGSASSQKASTSMIMSMLLTKPVIYNKKYDDEGIEVDDEGQPASGPDLWLTEYQSKRSELRVTPSLYLQYKILPWLTFKSTIGADYRSTEQLRFKSKRINSEATGSTGSVSHVDRLNWNMDNLFLFNKKFGKHYISGTLGQSMSQTMFFSQRVEGNNVPQWKAMSDALIYAPYTWYYYGETFSQLLSFFARTVYNYRERYILTATYRFDGSSKFAGKNKWAQFPSLAFAWRINNEPWFHVAPISSAKLRIGWGMVGNQGIPSYQTSNRYSSGSYATHDNETHKQLYITSQNLPSADLKWETTTQYNLGLDMGFFKGRLTFATDFYYKITDDLLQTRTVAGSTGISSPYVNMGSIENKGFEITLNAVPLHTKKIEWTIGGNLSLNRNKVRSIDPSGTSRGEMYLYPGQPIQTVDYFTGNNLSGDAYSKDYVNLFATGLPMCVFYGMPTDGIVQQGEQGVPLADGLFRGAGSINFVDTNKDGVISSADRVIIGDPNPDFTYGFTTSFRFRQFTLSASFNGSYGNDIYNQQAAILSDPTTNSANRLRRILTDSWSTSNREGTLPSLSAYRLSDVNWCSDRFVEDGSFLRLQDLSLSYNLTLPKKIFLRKLTVSVSGKNLFVWTKYSGYDPDVNVYGTVKKYGVDLGSYPSSRTIMLDLKLSF